MNSTLTDTVGARPITMSTERASRFSRVTRPGGIVSRVLHKTPLSAYARVADRRTLHRLGLVAMFALGAALLEVAALAATIPLIQLLSGNDLDEAGIPGQVADHFVAGYSHQTQTLIVLGVVVGLLLTKVVVSAFVRWFAVGVITTGATTATTNLFAAYLRAPLEFHTRRNSAAASRTATISMTSIFTTGLLGVSTALTESTLILLVGGLLFIVSPLSAIAAIAFFGVALMVFNRVVKHRTHELAKDRDDAAGLALIQLQQSLGGLREIRLRADEQEHIENFRETRTFQQTLERRLLFSTEYGRYFIEGTFFIGFGIIATVQILLQGDQAVAGLAVMLAAGFRLLPSAGRLLFAVSCVRQGEGSLAVVTEELDGMGMWKLESADAVEPSDAEDGSAGPSWVEVDNVTFRYADTVHPAISGISVTIAPGQSLGIVGTSGSGKTTLVDVICGLLAPTTGVVSVDGTTMSDGHIVPRVAYVPQDVFLLDGTIRRNIAFSDKPADAASLDRAVELAQLDRWLETLPDGLDTKVGERGALVSGGQRQRIGIARALYRNPSLLILDEATSALDVETEAELTAAITRLGRTITMIVVAHRLSTVRGCDRILVLEEGRVAGLGTYDDLSREHSTFSKWINLASSQAES